MTDWELIGGAPTSGAGVTQWGPGQSLDVFGRGPDDHLKRKWFPSDNAWSSEEDLGGTLTSEPAATSRTTNMRDVFWRGVDNHLKHKWYPYGEGWSPEQDLGGLLASPPSAVSWGTEALHVFWQGQDGNLKHVSMAYATDEWTAEIDVGISIESAPTALYRNNGVMDIFWRGSGGTLEHVWSDDGKTWSWIQDLGGSLAAGTSPTATGRRQGWIDVFWKGPDNHLKHVWMDTLSQWSLIEEDLGGNLGGSPAATFWGTEQLAVFAKDAPTGQMARLTWREDSVVTLNDTEPGIIYSNGWSHSPQRGLWDCGDDVHYTTTDGSYLEYTFTGTGVEYVTEREAHEGSVDVYVDGVFQATVNCYKADPRSVLQVLYSKKGMTSGSHTIRISKKDGIFMLLDALRIYR